MGNFFTTIRNDEKPPVAVIGSGPFGLELVKRLAQRGHKAIVASRRPDDPEVRGRVSRVGGEIMSYEDALLNTTIVIVAIPSGSFRSLPVEALIGKIVIDVSNIALNNRGVVSSLSLARQLQDVLSESMVVKAFNTLSAHGLQNNLYQINKEVPVCSDHDEALYTVMQLVRSMGFTPVNRGNLSNASDLEEIPLKCFPRWKLSGVISLVLFLLAFITMLFRNQICPNIKRIENNGTWDWSLFDNLLLDNVKTTFGLSAITVLSICFLPGIVAGCVQLYRGTRYREFPKCLGNWLESRKQLGLIALLFSSLHVLMVIFTIIEHGLPQHWTSYTQLAFGCFSIVLMSILGIASLPSVSQSLSWRESSCVFSTLGWLCLFFALLHMAFARWRFIITDRQQCIGIPGEDQIFVILPAVTVSLKLILLLPCFSIPIDRIRNGYERIA